MNGLKMLKSELFNSTQCDFWQNEDGDLFMTRRQIGEALEYANPQKSIDKIHERCKERLDKFSTTVKLGGVEGGRVVQRAKVLYSSRGIYEICRWSKQPRANDFYDWVYDLLEGLRRGETVIFKQQTGEDVKLRIQKRRAEAMLLNARTRQAKLLLDMQKNKFLSPVTIELLNINALEVITERDTHYKPEVEKTYTATEIAEELGLSANKIGKIANANGLKTAEFGIEVLDKSRYSNKQVPAFRYNEKGRKKLKEIISKTTA
ncbi:BRO family protein [Brevibacillus laterosporus]|uniref:BRO family protein n=1 Tax=Brevibacillus laterosporus TaxID=1465 RepID=UPI003D1E0819